MTKTTRFAIAKALVFALTVIAGCSSSSIVGEWHGESGGRPYRFTIFSDGTGDASAGGEPTKAITWKKLNSKFQIDIVGEGISLQVTLRENDTLSLNDPGNPEIGLLILRRKNDSL